jgi:hypothetical protein
MRVVPTFSIHLDGMNVNENIHYAYGVLYSGGFGTHREKWFVVL